MLAHCPRNLIFGGTPTVERYKGNPGVQVHGPGFSKILIGDDVADDWETVPRPDGRERRDQQRPRLHQLLGHLDAAPRQAIAAALAERLAAITPMPPDDPDATLAAFTVPGPGGGDLGRHRSRRSASPASKT